MRRSRRSAVPRSSRHGPQRTAAEDNAVHALGWLQSDAYLALAAHSLAREVMAPLGQRGLTLRAPGAEAAQDLA